MQLQADASRDGVLDLDQAETLLVAHENALAEKADDAEEYVEVLEKLRSMQTISAEGAALLLVAPGNVGIHLNQKGTSAANRKKLTTRRAQLSTKLGIALGEDWARDSPQYVAQLQKVKRRSIGHYQEAVESQVGKRKAILTLMERAESGKNTTKLRKSMAAVEA